MTDYDDDRKQAMWTAWREAWFRQEPSPVDTERPEFVENVAQRYFEDWYSKNHE